MRYFYSPEKNLLKIIINLFASFLFCCCILIIGSGHLFSIASQKLLLLSRVRKIYNHIKGIQEISKELIPKTVKTKDSIKEIQNI